MPELMPTGRTAVNSQPQKYSKTVLEPKKQAVHKAKMKNMAAIRQSKNITQQQLADMTGLNQGTISKAERGDDGVTLRVMTRIADALGVDLIELLTIQEAQRRALAAIRSLPPEKRAAALLVLESMAHLD